MKTCTVLVLVLLTNAVVSNAATSRRGLADTGESLEDEVDGALERMEEEAKELEAKDPKFMEQEKLQKEAEELEANDPNFHEDVMESLGKEFEVGPSCASLSLSHDQRVRLRTVATWTGVLSFLGCSFIIATYLWFPEMRSSLSHMLVVGATVP